MNDLARLRAHLEAETEGERTPAQVVSDLTLPQVEEVERLMAADKVQRARRVKDLAPRWDAHTRALYGKAWRELARTLTEAAEYVERFKPSDEIPDWLKEQVS